MVRTARALSLVVMVVLLSSLRSPVCQAWSLWPFGDSKAEQPPPKPKPAAKPAKKAPPSAWDNISTGTKSFCNKIGETVGLKKPAPKKPEYAIPRPMVPQTQSKSWFGSLFQPKDPPPPKDAAQFIGQKRPALP